MKDTASVEPPEIDLQALREELEVIDRELLVLLRRRMERVEAVAESKLARAFPFEDRERGERVLARVRRIAVAEGIDPRSVERLYRLIMAMSISHQQRYVQSRASVPLRVAYQGVEGSYSHLAAQSLYAGRPAGTLLVGHPSVYQAGEAVRSGIVDVALLPIENSTAGSINETYDLLVTDDLVINAEVVNRVEHCLLAKPGVRLEDLRRVLSHPQALLQCEAYLRTVAWIRPVVEFDTAGSAAKVAREGDPEMAAIASASAARMLGLGVLARGIQNQPSNATRFVEVARQSASCPGDVACKTSLLVELRHQAGRLGEVITSFGRRGINLCKLESRPVPETPWRYRFYLDVEAHTDDQAMVEALAEVATLVASVRVLGTYPIAREPAPPAAVEAEAVQEEAVQGEAVQGEEGPRCEDAGP